MCYLYSTIKINKIVLNNNMPFIRYEVSWIEIYASYYSRPNKQICEISRP